MCVFVLEAKKKKREGEEGEEWRMILRGEVKKITRRSCEEN